jgi:hypothetical protein
MTVLAAAFLVAAALPASAAGLYRWETESGGVAFTDDPKRIPARYRDDAVEIAPRDLSDYARFTEVSERRSAPHADRVEARLDHLRDLNARTVSRGAVRAPHAAGASSVSVRAGGDAREIENVIPSGQGGEPVVVETIRTRPSGSPVTHHVTVVRQGDEILSVIKPRRRTHSDSPSIHESRIFE